MQKDLRQRVSCKGAAGSCRARAECRVSLMKRGCLPSFAFIERKEMKEKHDLTFHFLIRISCNLKHINYTFERQCEFWLAGCGDGIRRKMYSFRCTV